MVNGYLNEKISDKEMTSWIEGIYINGMSTQESADYTRSIIETGVKLDFSTLNKPVVDKHSTGGVGDKVSLILVVNVSGLACTVVQKCKVFFTLL